VQSLTSTGPLYVSGNRIYDVLLGGFRLPTQYEKNARERIQSQYNWYKKHPEYMQRVWQRANTFLYYIKGELQKRGLPLELALLPIVESANDPFAYSHGRAAGLWQIIPGTGKSLGLKQNWWYDGRRDIVDSTRGALDYLESLNRQFDGDWLLAIAAYNSGAGNVRKGMRRNRAKNKPLDFWSLPLPRETKAYVPKLLALKKLFLENETRYLLPSIPDQEYFRIVETGSQLDLATAAKLAHIDLDTLYQLNPGFNHWATDPNGPHRLLIPIQNTDSFIVGLQNLPVDQRVKLQRYKVRNGDTLSTLAERNKTSISAIRQANNLRGSSIRAGKFLLIPQASTDMSAYVKSQDSRLNRLQNKTRKGNRIDYLVQSGDNFWSLARRYKVSVRALAAWNGMAPRDTLKIGQRLVIWSKSSDAQASTTTANFNPQTMRKINYRVRRGDTLSGIAQKFKVRTAQLRSWNKNRLKKYLKPGQNLTVIVDVRRQSAP